MPLPGPDTRVVELRVPGLSGASGEALLDSVNVVSVAGDELSTVIRPADRLRRPAPGPMVRGLGRSIPRTVEGYLWSKMTSGGAAKAIWALLFPFSLANVAHWMLPPISPDRRIAKLFGAACRSLLRVAGLLLTMLLLSQLAIISLDLLAAQCLSPGTRCLTWVPNRLREVEAFRSALGIVPLVIVIFVLYRISSTTWPIRTAGTDTDSPASDKVLRASYDTNVLRCLHTVVALACVSFLLLGGPFQIPVKKVEIVIWASSLAAVGLSLVLAAFFPERFRARSLNRAGRFIFLTFALLLVVAAAIWHTPLSPTLSGVGLTTSSHPAGADGTVESIGAGLLAVSLLFGLLLIPTALLARRSWRSLPKRLRPWIGGWAAAPVLALAGLLGGGFGAGLAIAVRGLLGGNNLQLPQSYTLITTLWAFGLGLAIVLTVMGFVLAVPLRRYRRGVPEIVRLLQTEAKDEITAAKAWARSAWERRHLHQLVTIFAVMLAAGSIALVTAHLTLTDLPEWLNALSGVGIATLGALAAGLIRVIYTAAKTSAHDRHLGALADLACFWPRVAHPTVPPCYALKVIPELVARTKEHLAEPNTRVVLSGQNVGSLLALATTRQLVRTLSTEEVDRLGLLTAGSPLQWGYQRAFPVLFPLDELAALYGTLGGRWRGLARGTDIFGGGVTTWRHQIVGGKLLATGYNPDGYVGPLGAAEPSETGALVLGGDHWLPDPLNTASNTRRWVPGLLRHRDYLVDPEWDHAVSIAAGLERATKSGLHLGEQVSLFGITGHPTAHFPLH